MTKYSNANMFLLLLLGILRSYSERYLLVEETYGVEAKQFRVTVDQQIHVSNKQKSVEGADYVISKVKTIFILVYRMSIQSKFREIKSERIKPSITTH